MSWWHICTKQSSHRTRFPFFTLCASLIALQWSILLWHRSYCGTGGSYQLKVSFHFLCSLSTVNKNWPRVRIWDCHSSHSRLRSRITALKLALVKSVWWRGKIWALVEGRFVFNIGADTGEASRYTCQACGFRSWTWACGCHQASVPSSVKWGE